MNNIVINVDSATTVINTLITLGFESDLQDNTKLYWSEDTNKLIYYKVNSGSTNITVMPYKSNGSALSDYGSVTFPVNNAVRLTYELIGNGIIFGAIASSNNGDRITTGIMAPVSQDDDWMYFVSNANNGPVICNGRTQNSGGYGSSKIMTTSGVQLIKVWKDGRYQDNLYIMPTGTDIPGTASTSVNNFIEATIGDDEYIVIELAGSSSYLPVAVKRIPTE